MVFIKDKYARLGFTVALMEGDQEKALNHVTGTMNRAVHADSRRERDDYLGDLIAMFHETRAYYGKTDTRNELLALANDMKAVRNTRIAWRGRRTLAAA